MDNRVVGIIAGTTIRGMTVSGSSTCMK